MQSQTGTHVQRCEQGDGLDEGLVHPPLFRIVLHYQSAERGSVLKTHKHLWAF